MPGYGLVLSADGSRSSYEIGAWKAIRETKKHVTAVSGSFIGALNAALIAQGDFERAVRFWRSVASKQLFDVNKLIAKKYTHEWSAGDPKAFRKAFMKFLKGASQELDPLREAIQVFINERAVRNSDVKFSMVSVSLTDFEPELFALNDIPRGKLHLYLLAACCFPQIAQIQGGSARLLSKVSPYEILFKNGCSEIISIDDLVPVSVPLAKKIIFIKPSEAVGLQNEQKPEVMKHHIKLGYLDTLKKFTKVYGRNYFICSDGKDRKYKNFKKLFGRPLPGHLPYLIGLLLDTDGFSRTAVEAKMYHLTGMQKSDDVFFCVLLESCAGFAEVSRDDKYTFDYFMESIIAKANEGLEDNKESMKNPNFLRNIIADVTDPRNTMPSSDTFMQYLLLLMSTNPKNYPKMNTFVRCLNNQVLASMVCLLYLLFA